MFTQVNEQSLIKNIITFTIGIIISTQSLLIGFIKIFLNKAWIEIGSWLTPYMTIMSQKKKKRMCGLVNWGSTIQAIIGCCNKWENSRIRCLE